MLADAICRIEFKGLPPYKANPGVGRGRAGAQERQRLFKEAAQRTLGVLLYRAERYEEAIEHQRRASATYAGEAFDLFFLAMQHWQIGRREEARDYRARAVAWMDEHNPEHPLLQHFRQEADELIGPHP